MQTVITLTVNPTIDKSASINRVVPERKLRCGPPHYEPGGGGINVSRAMRKLGGSSVAWYFAGGPTGQLLDHLLEQEGIEQHSLAIEGWTRENFTVFEEATGLQYRFGMPGPTVQETEWKAMLAALTALDPPPAYLVASGSIAPGVPDDLYARIARLARERNIRMVADTSGTALRALVQERVFLLKPNVGELASLVGEPVKDDIHLVAAASRLVEEGHCEIVVVSLGAGGALLVTAEQQLRLHAPTVPIQSKVGAGDSMVAGLTLALARGHSVREAAYFGVAAGTAAVMTPATELCRRQDTERLYRHIMSGMARMKP